MMDEAELYAEQMKHWFNEQDMLTDQIERTIKHHEDIAQSNREQLVLHNKRIELSTVEYNAWARKNGRPMR